MCQLKISRLPTWVLSLNSFKLIPMGFPTRHHTLCLRARHTIHIVGAGFPRPPPYSRSPVPHCMGNRVSPPPPIGVNLVSVFIKRF